MPEATSAPLKAGCINDTKQSQWLRPVEFQTREIQLEAV